MAKDGPETVDLWMADVDAERAPAMRKLRELCQAHLPGWSERIQWGMPGYGPEDADARVSFCAQKRHIALYTSPAIVTRFAPRLAGLDCGKGCIRYRKPDQMDFSVIADVLDAVREGAAPSP